MQLSSFPEIKTERLYLRRITDFDCDVILFLRSDETVNKFIQRPENRQTKNLADALKFINEIHEGFENHKTVTWGITLKNEPEIIGTICLWNFSSNNKTAEVGYGLHPLFQNQGIMSEAINRIIDFGFNELNLEQIEAYTDMKNENSIKLLVKNGFQMVSNRADENNASNLIFEINKLIA